MRRARDAQPSGRHYVTFTLRSLDGETNLGVVGAGFDPTGPVDQAKACASAHGWVLYTTFGDLSHAGDFSDWEGQPDEGEFEEGDVVVRSPLPLLPLPSRSAPSHCVRYRACCSIATRAP
eukprot:COSAG04_NODE_19_length_39217_cov_21.535968_16_plen_120_part_00